MQLSAELTLYPLQDDYLPMIKATVEKLNAYSLSHPVKVQTLPTATVLMGDYDLVMELIKDTMSWSYREFGQCVFVAKFLPGYEAL